MDTVSEHKILSQVIFDNEQNFFEYANAAENISVWEIIKDYAENSGLKFEFIDGEFTGKMNNKLKYISIFGNYDYHQNKFKKTLRNTLTL